MTCVCVHVRLDRALCEIKGLFPAQQEQGAGRRREGDMEGGRAIYKQPAL